MKCAVHMAELGVLAAPEEAAGQASTFGSLLELREVQVSTEYSLSEVMFPLVEAVENIVTEPMEQQAPGQEGYYCGQEQKAGQGTWVVALVGAAEREQCWHRGETRSSRMNKSSYVP